MCKGCHLQPYGTHRWPTIFIGLDGSEQRRFPGPNWRWSVASTRDPSAIVKACAVYTPIHEQYGGRGHHGGIINGLESPQSASERVHDRQQQEVIGTHEGTPQLHGEGYSGFTMSVCCHSGRWSHTGRRIMEHGRSQEYCEVRSTAHRKDMESTVSIHQAAVKASPRLESTITEGHLSQPSYSTVLHSITKEWHID